MNASGMRFTRTHEWVRIEGNKAIVGLTMHAVEQIRDIVFLDVKPVGTVLEQGASFGNIESVKAVFDLFSPVSGTIVAVNPELGGNTQIVADDPYGKGWLIEVSVENLGELGKLMDEEGYKKHLESEESGH